MKYIKILILMALLVPKLTLGATAVGWNTPTVGLGWIVPNLVNGVNQAVNSVAGFFTAASSTFAGPVRFPSLSDGCLYTTGTVLTSTGSACGSGGFAWPFTVNTGYVSTTTTLGLFGGFFSTASSTISNNFFLPSLSQGILYVGSNGKVATGATSTVLSEYVPYTGATADVNLGLHDLETHDLLVTNSFSVGQINFTGDLGVTNDGFLYVDSIDGQYAFASDSTNNIHGLLDMTSILAGDVTFTFPYMGGTVCIRSKNCPATTTANTWTGLQTFNYSSSTVYSSFNVSSSTSSIIGTLTLPNISGTQCLHSISGVVSGTGADCGSGGGSDPFTHPAVGQSATTSLMLLFGQASSTLFSSNFAQFGATATTTLTLDGKLGINTLSPTNRFEANLGSNEIAQLNDGSSASAIWGTNVGLLSQSSQGQVTTSGNTPLVFYVGGTRNTMTVGTEAMRIGRNFKISMGTTTPSLGVLTISSSTDSQLLLGSGVAGESQWAFRNAGNNLYLATTSVSGLSTSTVPAITVKNNTTNGIAVGIATSGPFYALSVKGDIWQDGTFAHFGNQTSSFPCNAVGAQCLEVVGNENNDAGVLVTIENNSGGNKAFSGLTMLNDRLQTNTTNYTFLGVNSSSFNSTTFGTGQAIPDLLVLQNTMGGIAVMASSTSLLPQGTTTINFFIDGAKSGNKPSGDEVGRFDTWGLKVGTTTNPLNPVVTIASSTGQQLALSAGAGIAQWAFRNAGSNLYISTTTAVGSATTSSAALTLFSSGNPSLAIASSTAVATLAVNTVSGVDAMAIGSSTGQFWRIDKIGHVFIPRASTDAAAHTYTACGEATTFELVWDTTTCALSNRESKDNIDDLDLGLEELMKVRPRVFNWKPTGDEIYDNDINVKHQQIGIIADEIAEIDSRLVTYTNEGKIKGFRYDFYTAWLTKAIQELAEMKGVKRSMEENWQTYGLILAFVLIGYQQWQLRKLKK